MNKITRAFLVLLLSMLPLSFASPAGAHHKPKHSAVVEAGNSGKCVERGPANRQTRGQKDRSCVSACVPPKRSPSYRLDRAKYLACLHNSS